jgi:plasmid stabilization system protein ParE
VRLRVQSGARNDIREIVAYYDEQRISWGDQFVVRLKESFRQLRAFPNSFPEIEQGVRAAPLAQFPFKVYYRVFEREIRVFAVIHAQRDPDAWMSRT